MDNLLFRCVSKMFDNMQDGAVSGNSSVRKSAKDLPRNQGFSVIAVISALVILCVIVSGIVLFVKQEPEKSDKTQKRTGTESVEMAKVSTPEPRDEVKFRPETEEIFLKAEKAVEEGDYGLARDLADEAFKQELNSFVGSSADGGSTGENYTQSKGKVLPVLKKMWSIHSKIREEQESAGLATNYTSNEGDDEKGNNLEPDIIYPPSLPETEDPEPAETFCGYTWNELEAMYDSDENRMWSIFWSCDEI